MKLSMFISYLFLIFYLLMMFCFLAATVYLLHAYLVEFDSQTFYYDLLEYDHKQMKLLAAYNFCMYMFVYYLLHYWSMFWLNFWWLFFNFLAYCSNVVLYFSWFFKFMESFYELRLTWFFSLVQFFLKMMKPLVFFSFLLILKKYNLVFSFISFFIIVSKHMYDLFMVMRFEIWLMFLGEFLNDFGFCLYMNYDLYSLNFFGF